MTEFYQEITPGGYGIAIKRKKTLFSEQSPFQKVEVFESDSTLGRVLTLDDLMMTTEGDEFHYHEMIAHIPMMHHKSPKTVLVIGGGDGGTVREVLKHDTVEQVVLCEIDGMVIDACKKYLPTISCELDNPKCEILVEDAIEYIKNKENMFDIILIDSTDDHFIVVSIPESEAESYQKRLESDPEFRENEIQQALGGTSADSRALPPGHIEYQSYMYKRDIKAAVDAASGSGTFDKWLTGLGWTVTAASIAKLIKLSKRANIFMLSADILRTLAQWAQQEREAWWKEAYKDIINGTISAVRYTIVQNTTEYPKIWRVFERI